MATTDLTRFSREDLVKRFRELEKRAAHLSQQDPGRGKQLSEAEPLRRQHLAELDTVLAEMTEVAERVQKPVLRAAHADTQESRWRRAVDAMRHKNFIEEHPEVAACQRELRAKRQLDERKKIRGLKAAKKMYEPVGGWNAASADALGAVFSSALLWESCDRRKPDGRLLEPDDVLALFWAVAVVAENRGLPVEFHFQHRPRAGMLQRYSEERMKHLAANGFVEYKVDGALRSIALGPRVQELRREFQDAFIERAKEQLKAERAAGRRKTTSSGRSSAARGQ